MPLATLYDDFLFLISDPEMLIFSCISLCAWLHAFSYKCIFVCMVSLNKWGIKNSTYCTTAKTAVCINNSFFIIKDTFYPDALCKDQIQGQIKISNYDINFLELHSSPFQTFEIFSWYLNLEMQKYLGSTILDILMKVLQCDGYDDCIIVACVMTFDYSSSNSQTLQIIISCVT